VRGVAYQQWPGLVIRVREIRIGKAGIRLTRTDPNHHPSRPDAKDLAWCLVLPVFCIGAMFGMSEDGPTKPDARSGIQGEVTPCEIWYFWVKSPATVSTKELSEDKPDPSALSGIGCPRILENPGCDYLEIK
jgi:hypothetical protein